MTRVKRGVTAHKRHKRLLKAAEGRRGTRSKLIKPSREALLHAMAYATRDRKQRKRQLRQLWIQRINAGTRRQGLSYGRFIAGLRRADLLGDRPLWEGALVRLEPLSAGESSALLDALDGGDVLSPHLRARVADVAEGNPLYTEQPLAMLAEEARTALPPDALPPTIQAPLSAPPQPKSEAPFAAGDLGGDALAGELGDGPAAKPLLHHPVGAVGMGVDPVAVDLDQLQGVAKLAGGVVGSGDQDAVAGHGALAHAAGIGGMGGDDFARGERDVGEKALVAPHQHSGQERGRQLHAPISAISRSERPSR